MIKLYKDILAAVIRDLRHELLGYTSKDGTAVRGDLDRELERLGVLIDGRVQPIDALPSATDLERQAHYAAEQFIEAAKRQGKPAGEARKDYIEQAGYSWINRLVALRALEARRLINGTLAPSEDYGGASEALYVLAQTDPARVAAPDGGWWAVLDSACAAQADALPGLFGAGDPVLTLRPSIPALRRCVERIGKGPAATSVAETDKAFADPDAIGWAYQFYQEEAKAAAFASFKAGKKADSRATIAAATQLFTEPYMVKWLLQNSLGRSYHEIYPQSALPAQWEYYIRPTDERPLNAPAPTAASLEMLTVMDPCVGSGHFLREAFDMLAAMYREQHSDWDAQRIVETILRRHLHGVDIDPRAVQLAALTLYMRALELLRDEARARRRPMPRWVPQQISLATTPSGLDAAMLERHLVRHPEDRPLRPVLERIFETLSQADILGSLLQPGDEIDAAIAQALKPQQIGMFEESTKDTKDEETPSDIRVLRALRGSDTAELKRLVLDRIATAFRAEADSADPADALFGREAERGVRLLQLLDRKYAVVATNPPYMGSKNANEFLKKYLDRYYTLGKRDLYTVYILRCLELCNAQGRIAMVTMQSWAFLTTFEKLRIELQSRFKIEKLAHLGSNAFDKELKLHIGVAVTCFVICNTTPSTSDVITSIRAIAKASPEDKANLLVKVSNGDTNPLRFDSYQSDFAFLPGRVLAYWVPNTFLKIFKENPRTSSITFPGWGASTCDNNRFLRLNWEVSYHASRWQSHRKGGGYSKWQGFNEWMLENEFNTSRLINFILERFPYLGSNYEILIRPYTFNLNGWCYTKFSNGSLSFRRINKEDTTNAASPAVFDAGSEQSLGAILNSRIASYLIRAICNKMDVEVGYIGQIPLPNTTTIPILDSLTEHCLSFKNSYNRRDIANRDFTVDAVVTGYQIEALLHTAESLVERAVFTQYHVSSQEQSNVLEDTGTPAGFHPLIVGYDALPELPVELELPELPREVIEYLERHERLTPSPADLARIKARLRALYEAGPGAKDDGADEAGDGEGGEEEEGESAVAGAHIPIPTETFLEELSIRMELHPISVYWLLEELRAEGARCKPEERRLLEDRLSVLALRLLGHRWPRQIEAGEPLPAWADADGIIPLVNLGIGEATLAERLRERLREEDGQVGAQRTEALVQELTGATGLEDWLARIFWPRHVRQFRSRPIAWHLASRPAGAGKGRSTRQAPLFECMLYYHATGGDALARLRTQYVEPLLRREESALNEALGKENTAAAASANLRVQELREFLARIQQVEREGFACAELDALLAKEPLDRWSGDGIAPPASRDDLLRQERAWQVDLNDGVRVNIAPIQLANLLPGEVLRAADAKKAIADRARWRVDERRWVREGKLPRPGWMPESVPESPEWTRKAPERAAEQARLEEKRRAVVQANH